MSQDYPYLQTITGIDDGVKAYAVQPISYDKAIMREEENPIYAFGPLASINIFVGATNAGKSRFLRTLIKVEQYQFYSEEIHNTVSLIKTCLKWLEDSEESLLFQTKRLYIGYERRIVPSYYQMPGWVGKALEGIVDGEEYELLLKSDFFSKMLQDIKESIVSLFEINKPKNNNKTNETYKIVIWIKNILEGEANARQDYLEKYKRSQYKPQNNESLTERDSSGIIIDFDSVSEKWRQTFVTLIKSVEYVLQTETIPSLEPPQRIYIPTLRSAVSMRDEEGKRLGYDIFEKTVRQNYKLDDTKLEIFTGNRLYDTLKRDRNGTVEVVDRLRDFEQFMSDAFFEGRRVEIVAQDESYGGEQHISVRVKGESPRDLHHLGDGINTLIILLYQLFMAKPGSWVFIEEPELNLHPGLQRIFLQTLLENEALQKKDLRIFFTTHSNHLLRMTLRDGTIASEHISVFAFQQRETDKDKFLIRPLISEHHDALALLGVQNASVLLAQCGIWVEGITDRQYLRAYLRAYQNSAEFAKQKLRTVREDTHFAFWEYAGSNLSHYLMSGIPRKGSKEAAEYETGEKEVLAQIQSSALCNRIFLVADKDKKKDKKHKALQEVAKDRSNFVYYMTPSVEIENLLSPIEISKCLPKLFNKQTVAVFTYSQSDYKLESIGKFLKIKYPAECPDALLADSGTLNTYYKNRLYELAVERIQWDTMSSDAKALARALHAFIAKHNEI